MYVEIYPRQLNLIQEVLHIDISDPHYLAVCVNDCIFYCLEPFPSYLVTGSKKGK